MNPMNLIAPMNMGPHSSTPRFPALPPLPPPPSTTFWEINNVQNRLKELNDTIRLAKAMEKELETLLVLKGRGDTNDVENGCSSELASELSKYLEENKIDLAMQESRSLEAANDMISKLRFEVEPFRVITDDASCPWEEKSAAMRLANKIQKNRRNKFWRKRKRKRVAEMLAKEKERFDQVDREADEWRAGEIAKDIAKQKVEKMKEIAKIKLKEERKKLESELELVLTVEKLQELRSIRIQKLKKQGHFLPEEDDKFLERVRAAVEEEERQARAAADAGAAKDAIATAEESRKIIQSQGSTSEDLTSGKGGDMECRDQIIENKTQGRLVAVSDNDTGNQRSEGPGSGSVASLPLEFFHYYHGSNTDMGTLIEVRRSWDAFIRPGGSRIPGHWVQPPPPSDNIWASYMVKPK